MRWKRRVRCRIARIGARRGVPVVAPPLLRTEAPSLALRILPRFGAHILRRLLCATRSSTRLAISTIRSIAIVILLVAVAAALLRLAFALDLPTRRKIGDDQSMSVK